MLFHDYFLAATGFAPYPYQVRLAEGHADALLVETGLGKTEGAVLAWDWRRRQNKNEPRRLIYTLPQRSLVEQSRDRLEKCFARLLADGYDGISKDDIPKIDVVMGGEVSERWFREPEGLWIVLGTQDMLLSRALNRGYGMSRFKWPMTFGALNNDAYWVIDEVQLQGIGAITAAQLQAFRERFGTYGKTQLTLMSATIDDTWFETADYSLRNRSTIVLNQDDYEAPMARAVLTAKKILERSDVYDLKNVAKLAVQRHRAGTRTLVIVNTVTRAQDIYRQLLQEESGAMTILLHSQFRPPDRERLTEELKADVASEGPGTIIVATQVIEAGIDISAATLITDVAPWSSLVQRFGRCNRRGEQDDARCIWLDAGEPNEKKVSPYDIEDIRFAREVLIALEGESVSPKDLPKHPIPLRDGGLVLRRPEFIDLFDTSPDLAGDDVDVSSYIRPGDDISVSVFWRDEPPAENDPPQRIEICSTSISKLRELINELRASGHSQDARVVNQFAESDNENWVRLDGSQVRPGILVWLRSDVGWYDCSIGFAKVAQRVEPVPYDKATGFQPECISNDGDPGTAAGVAVPLTTHAIDTRDEAAALVASMPLLNGTGSIIIEAALWHDVGKAHHVFQTSMKNGNPGLAQDTLWAKSMRQVRHKRPGFRHELPGALAYLAMHDGEPHADLVAYLIAAHHGKLRLAAQPKPYEVNAERPQLLGNRTGEVLPPVDLGDFVTEVTTISLDPFSVGTNEGSRSWIERTTALRDHPELGPFRLAFLEFLVRLADWRASEKEASGVSK